MVDKSKAVLNFILQYPGISESAIFVNFINAKNNDVQIVTSSNDKSSNRTFIDGSVAKRYIFSIVITKTITDMAIAKDSVVGENIDDLADIQSFMDWVNNQGKNRIYPDFGEECEIDEMHTTSENPSIDGINTEVSPALALYSMEIRIDYIDNSEVIWS